MREDHARRHCEAVAVLPEEPVLLELLRVGSLAVLLVALLHALPA